MKKILVMEDEDNIRSFVVINLRRSGFEPIEAENGMTALEKLKVNPDICLALLDVMLPDIDGFEVCRRIRATGSKIGIIMLTAMGQESLVSPRYIAMGNILSYLRARTNSGGSNVKTLYKIADNMVEAIEFNVAESFPAFGVPLKKLQLKKGILIGCIIRSNKVIFPHGDSTIEPRDSVVVITTNSALSDLRDILAN